MQRISREKIKLLSTTGLLAALIFLATYFFHIPIAASGGYIHLGDAVLYLAASMLPFPYAAAAAAIGAGFADLLVPGGAVWLPATLLIKPLCCLAFGRKDEHILSCRNAVAVVVAGLITLIGYGAATAILFGDIAVAIAELPFQIFQPVCSAVFYLFVGYGLDKTTLFQKRSN